MRRETGVAILSVILMVMCTEPRAEVTATTLLDARVVQQADCKHEGKPVDCVVVYKERKVYFVHITGRGIERIYRIVNIKKLLDEAPMGESDFILVWERGNDV